MLTRAHDGGARRQSSFPRLSNASSGTTKAARASLPTLSWLTPYPRERRCVLMMRHKCASASSAQASQTQRSAPRTRSRNERARGVLFESKRTRRCASSERVAMAAIKRSREPSRSGEMEDFGGQLRRISKNDAGNQTTHTGTKRRNARPQRIDVGGGRTPRFDYELVDRVRVPAVTGDYLLSWRSGYGAKESGVECVRRRRVVERERAEEAGRAWRKSSGVANARRMRCLG